MPGHTQFSHQLESWLKDSQLKTVQTLSQAFAEKSFAVVIMLLMFVPALPVPTGGITHVLELVVLLLCIEMMMGKKHIWLPRRLNDIRLGKLGEEKAVPFIMRKFRWFERFSRPRLRSIMRNHYFIRFVGLLLFILTLAAFFAVPFSGLDTLPSIAAVMICLGLLFDDALISLLGVVVGTVGVSLVIGSGFALQWALQYLI